MKRLRTYRKWVMGGMLPVLACVWLGAGASPCVSMSVGSARVAAGASHDHHSSSHHDHHYRCPFCPDGDGEHGASHIACATLAGFADGGKPLAAPGGDFTHVLPAVDVLLLDEGERSAEGPSATQESTGPPSVPLNLRYCVFLN